MHHFPVAYLILTRKILLINIAWVIEYKVILIFWEQIWYALYIFPGWLTIDDFFFKGKMVEQPTWQRMVIGEESICMHGNHSLVSGLSVNRARLLQQKHCFQNILMNKTLESWQRKLILQKSNLTFDPAWRDVSNDKGLGFRVMIIFGFGSGKVRVRFSISVCRWNKWKTLGSYTWPGKGLLGSDSFRVQNSVNMLRHMTQSWVNLN